MDPTKLPVVASYSLAKFWLSEATQRLPLTYVKPCSERSVRVPTEISLITDEKSEVICTSDGVYVVSAEFDWPSLAPHQVPSVARVKPVMVNPLPGVDPSPSGILKAVDSVAVPAGGSVKDSITLSTIYMPSLATRATIARLTLIG